MARIPRRKIALRALVFLVTVALIVAGAAAVPYVDRDGGAAEEPADYPGYDVSALVPDRAETGGQPAVEDTNETGVVLIDDMHSNRFDQEAIQPLARAISDAGYRVEYLDSFDDFDRALSRADALVVIDPGVAYSQFEADRVETFVEKGGRLVLLGEPTRSTISVGSFGAQLVPQRSQMATLSTRFGVEFGTGYLFNMRERDGNFRNVFADAGADGGLAAGVDRAAFYTATHVEAEEGTDLLVATEDTRNARGDTAGEFALAVRTGNVVAIGDTTFLERGNYNVEDNDRFVANLVRFMVGGDRERTILDYPAFVDERPTVRYTSVALLDPARTVANGLGQWGRQPDVGLERGSIDRDETDVLVTTFDHLAEHPIFGDDISLDDGRVAVPGYESDTAGLVVIKKVDGAGDLDLVVAVDTAERADRAADILANDEVAQYAIGDSTAVVRTSEAATPTPTPTGTPAGNTSVGG